MKIEKCDKSRKYKMGAGFLCNDVFGISCMVSRYLYICRKSEDCVSKEEEYSKLEMGTGFLWNNIFRIQHFLRGSRYLRIEEYIVY